MKTYKNLYPRICAFDNLLQAFHLAARGKRFKESVAAFEFRLEENLLALQDELHSQTYIPGAYHNFHIFDPKPRLISAAPFRDRVVHHALCQVIEPLFERRFIFDSYACRVGKGTHAALDRAFNNNVGFRVLSHDPEARPVKLDLYGGGPAPRSSRASVARSRLARPVQPDAPAKYLLRRVCPPRPAPSGSSPRAKVGAGCFLPTCLSTFVVPAAEFIRTAISSGGDRGRRRTLSVPDRSE